MGRGFYAIRAAVVFAGLTLSLFAQDAVISTGGHRKVTVAGYTGPTIVDRQSLFCSTVTSCTVGNFSTNPTSGKLIFVQTLAGFGGTCTGTNPTDTLGNSYGFIQSTTDLANEVMCTYYTVSGSSGTDAVTCRNSASANIFCEAALITGNAASPLDSSCKDTDGTTTSGTGTNNMKCNSPTTMTVSQNNELFIGCSWAGSGTESNGSLLTYLNVSASNMASYQQQTIATITPATTLSTSGTKYIILISAFHK